MRASWILVIALIAASPAMASNAGQMQAAVVADGKLVLGSKPVPEPAAGQVRIKVRAAAFNPVDRRYREREGEIPGFDTSGVVDAVGPGVSTWKRGDEVIAKAPGGSYAQYVVAAIDEVAKKPKAMSFEEAAGIPVVGETAYRALVEVANLQAKQRVLIHGASGGVGSAAVQIAKSRGAHVIAIASARNHEYLRSIGADEVIDYNTVRFEDRVKDADVVLNTVDQDTGVRSLQVLKPDGILVSIVGGTPADLCRAKNVRCTGLDRSKGAKDSELLMKVSELVDAGKYQVNIDRTFALADAQQAWDLGMQKHTRGKLVIVIPQ
jgi:NADPH:quinone reductase-like Zn-dependent oxidoreductase